MSVSPYLLLTLTSLFWAGNFVVGRAVQGTVPPIALAFWRWAVAFCVLAPFALPQMHRDRARLIAHWRLIVVLGVLGVGAFNTLVYIGLASTTATNGLLINSTTPIVIVLVGWLFLGQQVSATQAFGVGLSLAGVCVIVFKGAWAAVASLHFTSGDIWIFVAAVDWAFYTILLRRRPLDVSPSAFYLAMVAVGLAALAPLYVAELATGARMHLTGAGIGALLYMGVLPSVIANLFWNHAVSVVGPNRTGVFIQLMPVFGTLLAMAFLDEALHAYHIAGIVLILLGIVLATRTGEIARTEVRAVAAERTAH